ncbi:MAG: phosphopantetheine-binding protein [Crocinitomicaceae bacterium]|nr:phosphopantetheine-binding protein [Crocinitomicaceae bacterium]
MEQTMNELKSFIAENVLSGNVEFDNDTVLKELGVDSFSIVEIILFIERKYNKLIPDHKLIPETFSTLRNLATVIQEIEE